MRRALLVSALLGVAAGCASVPAPAPAEPAPRACADATAPAAPAAVEAASDLDLIAQTVRLSSATPGAVIHYTTDGSTPTVASPVYAGPFKVKPNTTVKALAIASSRRGQVASREFRLPARRAAADDGLAAAEKAR